MTVDDEDEPASFASPPCFMHEIDPVYMGLAPANDPRAAADVLRWRKAERARLIADRISINVVDRRLHSKKIMDFLTEAVGNMTGLTISIYWPFRGEPDLRNWVETVTASEGDLALPVVIKRAAPLIFRHWKPGDLLEPGIWNIPVPVNGDAIIPDVVIAPVVGFDSGNYRLGYGGGFFDRTLASFDRKPRVFGVGFSQQEIPTIYPQSHDIAMDAIITEQGLYKPA